MDYYLSIFLRDLSEDKFQELVKLLYKFSALLWQVDKHVIIFQTDDISILSCLMKIKETYPDARYGFSQYLGLAKGLSKIASVGEILISEEIESKVIEDFQITSLGMLTIEGMQSQILVCRVDRPTSERKFPEMRGPVPFIRRKRSLDGLTNLLRVSKSVLIYGAAGSGKTVFIDQFIEEMPDVQIYRTCCPAYPGCQALRPITNIVIQLLEVDKTAHIDEQRHQISKRLRLLGIKDIGTTFLSILDFLGLEDEDSILEKLDIKTRMEIITQTIGEILKSISRKKQLVLIFEDVDYMDVSSANLIQSLMTQLVDENILVIFTGQRPQMIIPGLREFELSEIEHKQLEEYVEQSVGENINLPPATPLHVAQYVTLYQEEKINYSYNQYRGESSLVNFTLPFADLKSIVGRRLELLGGKKEALYALALFGVEIDPIEFPGEQKDIQRFEYFVERNYLKRYDSKYVFVSAVLHDEIYGEVPDREGRHARNADYFRRLPGFEAIAAFHYQRASNYKKAAEYLIKAAALALRKGACYSGINYYNQALELCRREKEVAELEVLVAINEGLADTYRALGDEEKALKYYRVVLDSYKEILKE